MLKLKYISTEDVYDDPLAVENFMKDAIRDYRCDKPIFESEMPRQTKNVLSNALLNMQEFGSRYTHDPYHPELFLGDLSKDPRMSDTEPMVAQIADQNRFRYDRYIKGKLQDVADVRSEGMIGGKRMLKQIRGGFGDLATRMGGIFDDSFNTIVTRANPHPGDSIHKVGDTIQEDQAIYQQLDEKILPKYGTDIVSKLGNMIGVQWDVQPETRFGLSSVSNVYRSKQDVDQSVNAVFRLGKQDTKFGSETERFKYGTPAHHKDILKAARKNTQGVRVDITTDSNVPHRIDRMTLPPIHKSAVSTFNGTQSTKEQMRDRAVFFKFVPGTKRSESLVEPIKGNHMIDIAHATTIPNKDRIAIVYKINRTHKNTKRNEDIISKRSLGLRSLARAFVKRADVQHGHIIKSGCVNMIMSNGLPVKHIDHVSKVRLSKRKFAADRGEQTQANATGTNTLPTLKGVNDFEFDTDPTMNNNYQTRSGVMQKIGNLSRMQEQDSVVSPLNDTIAPMKTKYTLN